MQVEGKRYGQVHHLLSPSSDLNNNAVAQAVVTQRRVVQPGVEFEEGEAGGVEEETTLRENNKFAWIWICMYITYHRYLGN
jgi:hypothetical protein